ncbi:H+-ATPase G subunit-domain-containing protein [Aspergillus egyptiacus]|nr:H+-ATPase G subunit-domain-containing protein [Aspergillus egyptiacus]
MVFGVISKGGGGWQNSNTYPTAEEGPYRGDVARRRITGIHSPHLGYSLQALRPLPIRSSIYPGPSLIINMSAQNSAGIQTLLDAEREAQKIVQQAREYRTKRIRDAKAEAQKEIEEYRKQKEEEFKKFEGEHSSGFKKAEEDANQEAEVKTEEIKKAGKEKGPKVVDKLIQALVDVKPEPSEKIIVTKA